MTIQVVKESIFISAIRSFFNALFGMVGILIGLLILVVIVSSLSTPSQTSDQFVMEYLSDAEGNSTALPESTPVVLRVDIDGIIGDISVRGETVESILRTSRKGALKNNRVKAVLLYIDSPGGTVVDSDIIYQAVKRYKELYKVPVYTFASGLCASGGYYIACASDKIQCTSVSIVGSVGTKLGPFFNFADMLQKVGIEALSLADGKYKEKFPQFTKLSEGKEKSASYQDLIAISKQSYNHFLDLVDQARSSKGLTKAKLENEYGAEVYLGNIAHEYGYVDNGAAVYEEVLKELVETAGITGNYQVVRFSSKKKVIEELLTSRLHLPRILFGLPEMIPWHSQLLYYYES